MTVIKKNVFMKFMKLLKFYIPSDNKRCVYVLRNKYNMLFSILQKGNMKVPNFPIPFFFLRYLFLHTIIWTNSSSALSRSQWLIIYDVVLYCWFVSCWRSYSCRYDAEFGPDEEFNIDIGTILEFWIIISTYDTPLQE